MMQFDPAHSVFDGAPADSTLFMLVNTRSATDDPELRSLLWLLREGVIGRGHFEEMLTGGMRNDICGPRLPQAEHRA